MVKNCMRDCFKNGLSISLLSEGLLGNTLLGSKWDEASWRKNEPWKMKKSLSMGAVHSLLLDHLHSVSKIRCSDKNTLAGM